MYYIHVGGLWVRDRGCLGGECNKASYYLQFEEMEHVLGEEHARGADSKGRGTKRPHEEGDRTERCWRMSEFMAYADQACIPFSQSLPTSCPCNVVRESLTPQSHLDKRHVESCKTCAGAEAEGTQDLAGPAKAVR